MIRTEILPDGRTHTWSDANVRIIQTDTGIVYDDAVDQVGMTHIYAETDEPIEEQLPTLDGVIAILTGEPINE